MIQKNVHIFQKKGLINFPLWVRCPFLIFSSLWMITLILNSLPTRARAESTVNESSTRSPRVMASPSHFSLKGGTSFLLGTHKDSDNYNVLFLSPQWQYSPQIQLLINGALSHKLSQYNDPHHPNRQWEDLEFKIDTQDYWITPRTNGSLTPHLSLFLPTSYTSQKASLYGGLTPGISLSGHAMGWDWIWTEDLNLSFHKYDTADASGFIKNYHRTLSSDLSLTYSWGPEVQILISASLHHLTPYSGDPIWIQSYQGQISIHMNSWPTLFFRLKTKSRFLSNNSFFDDDNTYLNFGVVL